MTENYIYNILCVDDNDSNLITYEALISEHKGCRVLTADSASRALEILLKESVDLILLDIRMPEMDGFELAKLLKSNKRTRGIPVVFITAVFKEEEFLQQGYKIGAVDYLTKPINDHHLMNKINLYLKLFEKEKELEALNRNLENMVSEEIKKRREKEQILIHQSKMASMGEMIGAIAHQWRQPLCSLSLIIQDVKDAYDYGELDKEYIDKLIESSIMQIQYMSQTIDDFRDFYKPVKEKATFNVIKALKDVISMLLASFHNNNIEIDFDTKAVESPVIFNYLNEFKQVVINILNNAKDAILECEQKAVNSNNHGVIRISVSKRGKMIVVEISDNGGGVQDELIDKIFEPYFTTKQQGMGTGIGLYMSKVIIENNMSGSLYAKNIEKGAVFVIELPGI